MTPHIESNQESIAKLVLMPGDPLRAKVIADTFLKDIKLVNNVRGMTAYTGTYKNELVTIFPSGMGIPSMGIYAYELFKVYDVDKIIRVGSTGSFKEEIDLFDLILVDKSITNSNFALNFDGINTNEVKTSTNLNNKIEEVAKIKNKHLYKGTILCSETFYSNVKPAITEEVLGVEMESFALSTVANSLNKEATTLLTVSDNLVTKQETTSEERQNKFIEMMEIALEAITNKN